jgi:hypothetical protein
MTNMAKTAKTTQPNLDLLARHVHIGLTAMQKGLTCWKHGVISTATALASARELLPSDKEFGEWCFTNKFTEHLNRHERAALVMMGRDLDLLRDILAKTESCSIRLIYEREFNPAKITKDWRDKPDEEIPPEPTQEPQPKPANDKGPDPKAEQAKAKTEEAKAHHSNSNNSNTKDPFSDFYKRWQLHSRQRTTPPFTPDQAKKIRRVLHPDFHKTTPLQLDREKMCTEAFALFSSKMFELCGTEKP